MVYRQAFRGNRRETAASVNEQADPDTDQPFQDEELNNL